MRVGFELILMAVLTSFAADIITFTVFCVRYSGERFGGLRRAGSGEPNNGADQHSGNEQRFDNIFHIQTPEHRV